MKLNLVTTITVFIALFSSVKSFADSTVSTKPVPDLNSVMEQAMDDTKHVDDPSVLTKSLKSSTQPPATDTANPDSSVGLVQTNAPSFTNNKSKKPKRVVQDEDGVVKVVEEQKVTKDTPLKRITAEEAEYLKSLSVKPSKDKKVQVHGPYVPAPSEAQEDKHEGFIVERDSSKIVTKRLSYLDSLDVKVCFTQGLSIILDQDIKTEMQTGVLDDKTWFGSKDFENHRGVYVHLTQAVPDGYFFESAVRIVRKDNDKTYLVNLMAVPCPKEGVSPYPKVIYIKDKLPSISGKNTHLMTPEDTIIQLSQGLPRKNTNVVTVYDMIARSTSDWAIFGIQVQLPPGSEMKPDKLPVIKVLNNLQMDEIPAKVEYLPIPSYKETENNPVGNPQKLPTARFKVLVNVDKQYFNEDRYIYFMFVDKENGFYQYVRMDTLPYVFSLRERGFDF
jgi:hypothetical protein